MATRLNTSLVSGTRVDHQTERKIIRAKHNGFVYAVDPEEVMSFHAWDLGFRETPPPSDTWSVLNTETA